VLAKAQSQQVTMPNWQTGEENNLAMPTGWRVQVSNKMRKQEADCEAARARKKRKEVRQVVIRLQM
jgi:hypothetical protein